MPATDQDASATLIVQLEHILLHNDMTMLPGGMHAAWRAKVVVVPNRILLYHGIKFNIFC